MTPLPRQRRPLNPNALRASWRAEIRASREAADSRGAWTHLERAHILSQPLAAPHMATHALMFHRALKDRTPREALGQLVRLFAAGPGSLTRRYPLGNTGTALGRQRGCLSKEGAVLPGSALNRGCGW